MHILLLACTRYYVFIYLFTKYVCMYPASSSLAEVRVSGVCTSVHDIM